MANPNIVNVTTIYGNTAVLAAPYHASGGTAVAGANIVQNSTSSGYVYKINFLSVTNNTASTSTVTLDINRNATVSPIAYKISVPSGSTLVLLAKDTGLYLLESDALQVTTSATNSIIAITSYEQISTA